MTITPPSTIATNPRTGRANNALREVSLIKNFTRYAEGSVLVSFGYTRVLCNASVLDKVPPHQKGTGQGWVTAEYAMLPRATHSRSEREAAKGKQTGRTQEIQRLIGRSLRAGIDLSRLGERTIHLDCDVLQADGGTRTAAITGAFVAMQHAVQGLLAQGKLVENPILGHIAAVSAGVVDGEVRLDLDYLEDSNCDADVNIVMNEAGGIIEVQGTAEGAPFSTQQLNALLSYAQRGIEQLVQLQKQGVRDV